MVCFSLSSLISISFQKPQEGMTTDCLETMESFVARAISFPFTSGPHNLALDRHEPVLYFLAPGGKDHKTQVQRADLRPFVFSQEGTGKEVIPWSCISGEGATTTKGRQLTKDEQLLQERMVCSSRDTIGTHNLCFSKSFCCVCEACVWKWNHILLL